MTRSYCYGQAGMSSSLPPSPIDPLMSEMASSSPQVFTCTATQPILQAWEPSLIGQVLTELVSKMRDMRMDKTELGCLRAIILFNPDAKGLSNPSEVEVLREKVYASLETYCKQKYPEQQGRFAKLLLRLPALRSIGLKCLEHLFFFKLIGDTPIDTFLMEMLEAPHQLA
uniref:Retinoid X receptor beta n=1 Tax=Myotis myotis TaxID=51298 RepID=A0A7J7RKK7_MYOMY|nr:retinoid X receptor beta [Myotis myotis]